MRSVAQLAIAVVIVAAKIGRREAMPTIHSGCSNRSFELVTRAGWGARDPASIEPMSTPVSHVVIHHSYIPGPCSTEEDCEKAMRAMQNMHVDQNGWVDIGYSFAVGGDGRAYEGRGWCRVGAHAPPFNAKSIGICTIGDFRYKLPPSQQLETIKKLIAYGVEQGWVDKDYKLIGHRQARVTECPGDALFEEINTWPHYSSEPASKFIRGS